MSILVSKNHHEQRRVSHSDHVTEEGSTGKGKVATVEGLVRDRLEEEWAGLTDGGKGCLPICLPSVHKQMRSTYFKPPVQEAGLSIKSAGTPPILGILWLSLATLRAYPWSLEWVVHSRPQCFIRDSIAVV